MNDLSAYIERPAQDANPIERERPSRNRNKIVLTMYSLGLGGADRVACLLANGFHKAGYDTYLLVWSGGDEGGDILRQLIDKGVALVFLGEMSGSRTRDLITSLPKAVAWIKTICPDYIVATGNSMNWISAAIVKLTSLKTRLVMKTTNPILRPEHGPIIRRLRTFGYGKAFAMADAVLTLTDAESAILAGQFPAAKHKFHKVINPYVTPEMIAPSAVMRVGENGKTILGIGRFVPQKRSDLLIRAFALLADKSTRLVLLGDGPERAKYQALVDMLGLGDRVAMPGFQSDVRPYLHDADLFVLSSRYEGLPAVVLEAMAANCRIVSTRCFAGIEELLDSAGGCAIAENDSADALAEAMSRVLEKSKADGLREAAMRYSVDNGILSHLHMIAPDSAEQ